MRKPLLEFLQSSAVVCDGAMGTELYAKGVFLNRCFDELNLSQPALVRSVHQDYLIAGAEILETNTFGANRLKLEPHGLADRLEEIIRAGVRVAREVAGDAAYVGGSIGPLGVRVQPYGKTSMEEAKELFLEQARILAGEEVDLICLETFHDLNEIQAAIQAVQEVCSLPIMTMFMLDDDGNSKDGSPPEDFARKLAEWGANLIGVNCGVGPQVMLESLERIAGAVETGLVAQPNAGKPRIFEGRNLYLSSPEYMASYARRFIRTGVQVVGGCCGTTPAHIRAIRDAIHGLDPRSRKVSITSAPAAEAPPAIVPPQRRSRLAARLHERQLEVVRIVPPQGGDSVSVMEGIRLLKEGGVDAVRISEAPRSSASMGALALSVLAGREVDTVLHYTCRDRNLLVMQSELLGAHALGVRNLFLSTGEPLRIGDTIDATSVMDVDAIGLTRLIAELNAGRDLGGKPLAQPMRFFVGVSVNPESADLAGEVGRLKRKIDAGAHFAVAEPVFRTAMVEKMLESIRDFSLPVVVGVRPCTGLQDLEYLANEAGVPIPDSVIERMSRAGGPERQRAEGIALARETVAQLRAVGTSIEVWVRSGDYAAALEILS